MPTRAALEPLAPVPLAEIRAARERIQDAVYRTPLVRLHADDAPGEIHLKLENLQPIGSFKLRGAGNAIACVPPAELASGVATASAGNMAQGVAWHARRLGVACRVLVPEHAPRTKLEAIARLGGEAIKAPFDEWWQALVDHGHPALPGHFIHPVSDPRVVAGNGTIGLEIFEDLPDVDAVLVPFGGGGLSCGIAAALRALRPGTKVWACEVETAAPLRAALEAGAPRKIDYTASFVDGIGSGGVLPEMWPMARELLAGSIVVTLDDTARALRLLLERNRILVEGAAAVALAAALTGRAGHGKIVCVLSGGNLDLGELASILERAL